MLVALGVIVGLLIAAIAILFSIYLNLRADPVKHISKLLGRKAVILEPDLLPKDREGEDIPIEELL